VAWIVAGSAVAIALCEALALTALLPLKTVVPYTLLVDRQTGFVQALKPLDAQVISADRALTQSFLVQYVIAREGFDRSTLQADYKKVALWSTGSARADYLAAMQAGNPLSPLNTLPGGALIDVDVKSVTPLGARTALVRFNTRYRAGAGQPGSGRAWAVAVRYRYAGEPMSQADRFTNPLGFEVERYRRSEEVLPDPSPEPVSPVARASGPGTASASVNANAPQ
jgi:type IV secretion system protein VirB8